MSRPENDREGLSPSPSNILDIFTGDEDDDDDMESYQPTEEQSTDASGLNDEEDSDVDFAGTLGCIPSWTPLANTRQTPKRP